jgi:hypothetical protein
MSTTDTATLITVKAPVLTDHDLSLLIGHLIALDDPTLADALLALRAEALDRDAAADDQAYGCECEMDWNCPLHGGTSRPTWLERRYDGGYDPDA